MINEPKKRGRKPIGDRPMTAAERQRRSRERKAEVGAVFVTLELAGPLLERIDAAALEQGVTRSAVLRSAVAAAFPEA